MRRFPELCAAARRTSCRFSEYDVLDCRARLRLLLCLLGGLAIQGRSISGLSFAHRLAPSSGSSAALIASSSPLTCSSVSANTFINA